MRGWRARSQELKAVACCWQAFCVQNLPYAERDGQAGKWREAGLTSYLEVQLRLKQSAHPGLTMTLKLTLSCWPSLTYSRSGPTAGNDIALILKTFSPFMVLILRILLSCVPFQTFSSWTKFFKFSLRGCVLYFLIAAFAFLCLLCFEFIFLAKERQNI